MSKGDSKLLTFKNKYFKVRELTSNKLTKLLSFSDSVGFDGEGYIFKLNLEKCVGKTELLEEILQENGFYLSKELKRYIEERERGKHVIYIKLQGSDLIISSPEFRNAVTKLRNSGINPLVYEIASNTFRTYPYLFPQLKSKLEKLGFKTKTNSKLNFKLSFPLSNEPKFKLRDYQIKAYNQWKGEGCRGVIVSPVASGKTFIALKAIYDLKMKTIVLVPTIDLLHQWKERIVKYLAVEECEIGILGGGERNVNEITVATYKSASKYVRRITDKFGLIIADECHHSVSPSYSTALKFTISPFRLGLTATPVRKDVLHLEMPKLIGPFIVAAETTELQRKGYIEEFEEEKIFVDLTEKEKREYRKLMNHYWSFVRQNFPQVKSPIEAFNLVLRKAKYNKQALEALRAKNKANQIALNAERKIDVLEKLLEKFRGEKVIIFSRYVDLVKKISRTFLIPEITHETPRDERRKILEMFSRGEINVICSGEVLDEGIDVPDALVGIILSGTGSTRQYLQRLGRIMRKKGRKAKLIEIIAAKSIDENLSLRRRGELPPY